VMDIVSCSSTEAVQEGIEEGAIDEGRRSVFGKDPSRVSLSSYVHRCSKLAADGGSIGPSQDRAVAETLLSRGGTFPT
jgi:hypothetical protein